MHPAHQGFMTLGVLMQISVSLLADLGDNHQGFVSRPSPGFDSILDYPVSLPAKKLHSGPHPHSS
jgi:hypothetical protein